MIIKSTHWETPAGAGPRCGQSTGAATVWLKSVTCRKCLRCISAEVARVRSRRKKGTLFGIKSSTYRQWRKG